MANIRYPVAEETTGRFLVTGRAQSAALAFLLGVAPSLGSQEAPPQQKVKPERASSLPLSILERAPLSEVPSSISSETPLRDQQSHDILLLQMRPLQSFTVRRPAGGRCLTRHWS